MAAAAGAADVYAKRITKVGPSIDIGTIANEGKHGRSTAAAIRNNQLAAFRGEREREKESIARTF